VNDGLLLVDKPYGMTSSDVVQRVRRVLDGGRVGHAGTLDPLATGLLPILLGKATPLLRFLPAEPKVYRVVARFGVATATGDAEGEPVETADPGVTPPPHWDQVVKSHEGALTLPVPRYAAVKVAGRPLYRYSRAGQDVVVPERVMQVHQLTADPSGWPWVAMEMHTAGGTYVRAVVESLGRRCGLPAHVASLRRLQVGPWSVAEACTLLQWETGEVPESSFLPLKRALQLPEITLDLENSRHVAHGRMPERVHRSEGVQLAPGEPFLFVDLAGDALAVAECHDGWHDDATPPRCHFERVLTRPS
jgi:tRNA pseudouridine55 synthase